MQKSPTTEHRPGQQWRFSHHRQPSTGRITKRPVSQPSGYNTTPQAFHAIQQPRSAISISERWKDLQVAQKFGKLAEEAKTKFNYGPADRPSQAFLEDHIRKVREERAAKAAAKQQNSDSPTRRHPTATGPRPSVTTDFTSDRFRSDILNVEQVYSRNPKDVPTTVHSPFSPDSLRRSREDRLAANGPQPSVTSQPNLTQSRFQERLERYKQQYPHVVQQPTENMDRSMSTGGIDSHNKLGEEHNIPQARHSLSLLLENGKRGRVSPLPQAVQGAQGRNSGPASDPGIKNEFGRMFSGIGSGVGISGPMGSGASTPFPGSPKVNHEPERRTPFAARGELTELTKRPKERSKMGRSLLADDDDPRTEAENGNTPSGMGASATRGTKRRHGHHHHLHNHRHHHHRHEEAGAAGSNSLSAINGKRLSPAFVMASQRPATTLGFSSIPTPLPRFEGKENCTFTIRIPRFYLSDLEREEVTRRRALWGCDVYTDDSDPLAAAIHSGWVQGHWGNDIDLSMLETADPSSRPTEISEPLVAGTVIMTSPPQIPMIPPMNRDLHLTCLVLPPLEKYTSKICHGIKSREWGNNHDGMSFRIQKVEWLDDGVSKGEERTGEARKKRTKTLLEERRGLGRGLVNPVVTVAGGSGNVRRSGQDIVMVGA
ncbi:MAG: hypothetical protein Q9166_000268 [cf. Caloplaca sp. 2 TL-2023]